MGRGRKKLSEDIVDESLEGNVGPIDAYVGSRMSARRRLLQMSQKHMAERLGVTFQQVQKYEKGINRIGAGRLYSIAKILGVDVGYFFEEIEYDAFSTAISEYADGDSKKICNIGFFNEEENRIVFDPLRGAEATLLLKAFYSLPPKSRKGLIWLLTGLKATRDEFDDDEEC
jgi:transcriptional regulator with XRE-family HTH domain